MSLRNQILNVSRSMLHEGGVESLSMRKIAREIDVTATSIYLHFENKDHLIQTLIHESVDELYDEIRLISESDMETYDKIHQIARYYISFGLEHPEAYEVIFMRKSEGKSDFGGEGSDPAGAGYELLADVIREAVEKNKIVEGSPLTAAYIMWAQLHGVVSVILHNRLDSRIPENEFVDHSIEDIVEGFFVNKYPV